MTCTILSAGEELLSENKNEYEKPYIQIQAELYVLLDGLYAQGYRSFYLNCEYGIPLWAAEIILAMKRLRGDVELHIVMPFEEQAVRWQEDIRNRYFRVHERADSVTMASRQFHPDCYSQAERLMIDKSDLLVICGSEGALPGAGQYARSQETEVFYAAVPENAGQTPADMLQ